MIRRVGWSIANQSAMAYPPWSTFRAIFTVACAEAGIIADQDGRVAFRYARGDRVTH